MGKGKTGESQRRKATGPRLHRDAFYNATKEPKIAGLPKPSTTVGTEVGYVVAQEDPGILHAFSHADVVLFCNWCIAIGTLSYPEKRSIKRFTYRTVDLR